MKFSKVNRSFTLPEICRESTHDTLFDYRLISRVFHKHILFCISEDAQTLIYFVKLAVVTKSDKGDTIFYVVKQNRASKVTWKYSLKFPFLFLLLRIPIQKLSAFLSVFSFICLYI